MKRIVGVQNRRFFPYLMIGVVSLLLYGQTLWFGFTNLDDRTIILDNFGIIGHLSNLPEAFTTDAFVQINGGTFYRPMQTVSFMIDAAIGGNNAWIYHTTNVLLHLLTCYSLYGLLVVLGYRKGSGLLLTLFYCVSPLLTHAVAWVPSRGDLMIAFFGLLSFLRLIRFIDRGKMSDIIVHGIALLVACLSKETALLFPVFFAGYCLFLRKTSFGRRERIILGPVWILAAGLALTMRSIVLSGTVSGQEFGIGPLISNIPIAFLLIGKLFVPLSLSTMPLIDPVFVVVGGVAFLVIIIPGVWIPGVTRSRILFGMAWYFLFLLPTLLYRHPLAGFAYQFFEHRAYLPVIGIIMVLAEILRSLEDRSQEKAIRRVFAVVLPLFSVITILHGRDYRDPERFFGNAISGNPRSALAYNNLAMVKFLKGDLYGAHADVTKAIEIDSGYAVAYYNRALIYVQSQSFDAALSDYARSLSLDSTKPMVWFNRAIIRWLRRDLRGSLHDCEKAMELLPGLWIWYFHRANLETDLGEYRKAISDFDSSITAYSSGVGYNDSRYNTVINNPTAFADVYCNRGKVHHMMGADTAALADCNTSLSLNPNNPDAYHFRALAKTALSDFTGALQDYQSSLAINQAQSQVFADRAMLRLKMHDGEGACSDLRNCARLGDPVADSLLRQYCAK